MVTTELEGNKRLALSPDGKWVACRHRGKTTTMQYRGPFAKQAVNYECKQDAGWVIGEVEFAAAGRIVVMMQNRENASVDSEMRFIVYDAEQGKQLCAGSTPRLFHPCYSSFSPGGNYMAMMIQSDEGSNFLGFWDLRTGKQAGAIDLEASDGMYGISFSPDGEKVTLLFETPNGAGLQWGRVGTCKLADRAKVHDHALANDQVKITQNGHHLGGKGTLQWLPDGGGWLVLGYLVMDRDTGKIVGEIARPEKNDTGVIERVFRGNDQATDVRGWVGRDLTVIDVPRAATRGGRLQCKGPPGRGHRAGRYRGGGPCRKTTAWRNWPPWRATSRPRGGANWTNSCPSTTPRASARRSSWGWRGSPIRWRLARRSRRELPRAGRGGGCPCAVRGEGIDASSGSVRLRVQAQHWKRRPYSSRLGGSHRLRG